MKILYIVILLLVSFILLIYIDVSYTGLFYSELSNMHPEWELISQVDVRRNEISSLRT